MAKEKKITTLSGDAKENLKQVKENFKDAEKMRKDLNPQYKAVKEQMYKKWLDSCESLFDDIDDDMNFIDALKLLALGKEKKTRTVKPGEIVFSKNGTPIRIQ